MATAQILTKRQQGLIRRLSGEKDLADTYVLSGGTALAAFYLEHRLSDDLDFFTEQPVDLDRVIRFMEECRDDFGGGKLDWQKLYDRRIFQMHFPDHETLKVEFTQFPYSRLDPPKKQGGILIDSIRDIAAGKLAALLDRNEPKDYYDLYFLINEGHTTLEAMKHDAEKKFQRSIDPLHLGAELNFGMHLPVLPHLLKPVDPLALQRFFDDLMKTLRSEVIEE